MSMREHRRSIRQWLSVLSLLTAPISSFPLSPSYFNPSQLRSDTAHYGISTSQTQDKADKGDDLTKQELNLRFAEVRDYYRKTNEMSQENVRLSMLRTRIPNLRLNRCFVKQSTIEGAGNGLFTTRDIEEGELITMYPGDALLVWNQTVGDFQQDVGVMFGVHVKGKDRDAQRVSTDAARGYELKIKTAHSIVADPLLVDDTAYLGHMINDGAVLMNRGDASRELYNRNTVKMHNAAFMVMEGCHYATIATARIRKGREIFCSYGEGYWLSRTYNKSDSKITSDTEPAGEPGGGGSTKRKKKKNQTSNAPNKGFG